MEVSGNSSNLNEARVRVKEEAVPAQTTGKQPGPEESAQRLTPEEQPVTVVGAGNWLLAQDRLGYRVLELAEGRFGPEVELRDIGTAGLGLLDCLRGQELLIVVDAGLFGGMPGEVRCLEPDFSGSAEGITSVHQLGPLETLTVAWHLFPRTLPKRIVLLAVETKGLDEAGEATACEEVLSRIDREISGWHLQREDANGRTGPKGENGLERMGRHIRR